MPCTQIWFIIVRHIVNVVFLDKRCVDNPRGVRDDLIHPATMADSFATFCVFHYTFKLVLFYLLVAVHPNEEVYLWERHLGLTKL